MTAEWHQVLRALVYNAHDARGTEDFEAACNDIVDAHTQWPLAEALWYLDEAHREREKITEAIAAIRESYVDALEEEAA